jgi:hypothetical protein
LIVFAAVQDRTVADGVGRYVALKRAALAGQGPETTIDAVMTPAIDTSVRRGAASAGVVLAAGAAALALRRRAAR